MTTNISDKVIIVTGASSGLGAATARRLAASGAKVVLAARRGDRIEALADEIKASGKEACCLTADVSDKEQLKNLADRTVQRYGCIDVLINNAGVMPLSRVEELDVDGWERMIDINLKGVLFGVAAVLPYMIERRSGHIINVASTAGHRVAPTTAIYSATKYGVRAFSEGLRQELTPHNIRCTIISPGASATDLFGNSGLNAGDRPGYALSAETFAEMAAFAISQPPEVDVNEILYRPTSQER